MFDFGLQALGGRKDLDRFHCSINHASICQLPNKSGTKSCALVFLHIKVIL